MNDPRPDPREFLVGGDIRFRRVHEDGEPCVLISYLSHTGHPPMDVALFGMNDSGWHALTDALHSPPGRATTSERTAEGGPYQPAPVAPGGEPPRCPTCGRFRTKPQRYLDGSYCADDFHSESLPSPEPTEAQVDWDEANRQITVTCEWKRPHTPLLRTTYCALDYDDAEGLREAAEAAMRRWRLDHPLPRHLQAAAHQPEPEVEG